MKKLFGTALSLVFFFSFALIVSAQTTPEIPERNGDFAVPGRSDLRVRVFVHEPKERPSSSALTSCDNPNVNDFVGATGWKLPSEVKYEINTSSVPSAVGSGNMSSLVSSSFATWTGAITSSSPTLIPNGTTNKTRKALDGHNIIAWGRTSGSALGVTYTWYYTATNVVAETDTILNVKFPWSLDVCSPTSYDARDILTHELGHWFGLDDEYAASYVDNTMFGYGSKGETKKVTLEQGDKNGINAIY